MTEHVLWKPVVATNPEPVAILEYGGEKFVLPYTLVSGLVGVVAIGAKDTCSDRRMYVNTQAALEHLEQRMGADASPLTPEQTEFYRSHNLLRETKPFELPYQFPEPISREEFITQGGMSGSSLPL